MYVTKFHFKNWSKLMFCNSWLKIVLWNKELNFFYSVSDYLEKHIVLIEHVKKTNKI